MSIIVDAGKRADRDNQTEAEGNVKVTEWQRASIPVQGRWLCREGAADAMAQHPYCRSVLPMCEDALEAQPPQSGNEWGQ